MQSLHPLWEREQQQWPDPLAHGKQTLSTTALDAEPESISTGEPDTPAPLLVTLGLAAILLALLARLFWLSAAFAAITLAIAAVWTWPEQPEPPGLPDTHEERSKGRTHGDNLPLDDSRGTLGMKLFILSEALVFVCLFFAYFYLGHRHAEWPTEMPKLPKALVMLGILLASSATVHLADHAGKELERARARVWLGATIALAFAFLAVQYSEYDEHLKTLKPWSDAYGSIFYTLTSFHAAHLVLGLLLLLFAFALPKREPREHTPHKPLHNAALYWHFVDVVWVLIVGLVYVLPHLK